MSPIEALADGIMFFEGWKVGSRSYRNRNPGNLRASPFKSGEDPQGYAIFCGLSAGYAALTWDLSEKVCGMSAHNLGPTSTMLELLSCYAPAGDGNNPSAYCEFVCGWLTRVFGKKFTPASELRLLLAVSPVLAPDPKADEKVTA